VAILKGTRQAATETDSGSVACLAKLLGNLSPPPTRNGTGPGQVAEHERALSTSVVAAWRFDLQVAKQPPRHGCKLSDGLAPPLPQRLASRALRAGPIQTNMSAGESLFGLSARHQLSARPVPQLRCGGPGESQTSVVVALRATKNERDAPTGRAVLNAKTSRYRAPGGAFDPRFG